MRKELRAQRGLLQEEAALVSRAVFAYFRWRGWLDSAEPIPLQVETALAMAARFAKKSDCFSDTELVARAVPGWLSTVMEVTADWVRTLQAEPKLWLRARSGLGRAVASKLGHCRAAGEGPLADALEYRGRSDLFKTKEFHAGEFELQDLSSQAVGLICDPRPGETWWDACAGEGGKTLHLSNLMNNKGLIWASDRADWRLASLKRRAARAGVFNYRLARWDGGPKPPLKGRFDGVLVDAPCSGIGTWQRNPHARWTTTALDVEELSEVQIRLLLNAAAGVKPGGKLVYAACTLARSESRGVVSGFEQKSAHFQRLELRNPLTSGLSVHEPLFLLPQETNGNGMVVAAWVRTSS
ncbi:MAG: RsmB/NOP family class I SAM-dependent RNA methyltransferase [Verrucomicrobia bacterium]|nr:RsmB/NOP family class I SAM-dependent RNA methyltransferase [Verrucomicrobiota bacterium]